MSFFVLTCLILLVDSFVNFISTRKKRKQKKKLLSQLSESDTDFTVGQNNNDAQIENNSQNGWRKYHFN